MKLIVKPFASLSRPICSCVNVSDQVSQPHNTMGNVIVLCVQILTEKTKVMH